MNMKRFVLAASVIFMFALIWNALVHMVILREANAALGALARPGPDRSIVLSLLQTAGLSAVFVLSHVWSRRAGTLKEGLAHGALFGVLAGLLVDLNQYILYPIPGGLATAWFAFGFAEFCIYGLIAALVYRQDAQA
jgi:uncharacterized membrane protein YhfC